MRCHRGIIRCKNGAAIAHTRIGWYRAVSNILHGFAIRSFADELEPLGNARDGPLAICAVALVPVEGYFRVEPCGECHERCPFALLFRIKKVGLFGIDRRIVADAHQLSAEQFALDEDARQQSEPETRYGRVNRGNQ